MNQSETPIRVFIVEDQAKILKNQLKLLSTHPSILIVGTALSGESALAEIETQQPDVVLLDLGLPLMDGIEVTRQLKMRWPSTEILIFTIFDEEDKVIEAVKAGASGYLLKGTSIEKIVEAIKEVRSGGTVIQPTLARRLLRHFRTEEPRAEQPISHSPPLSEREKQILKLIAQGVSNNEAAQALGISKATIRTHLEHIYQKLEVSNRVEAVTEGIRKGIIKIPE